MARSRGRRAIGRFALVIAASLLACVVAEVAVRALRLDRYARPRLRSATSDLAELSRIRQVFDRFGSSGGGSFTQMPASFVAYGWYDRPQWSYFDADGCVEYRINSLGFRDREFSTERRPGELRILALGDSFTFGQGVQLEDCWPQVLERSLASGRSGPVEVINGGYCRGHAPDTYAGWLADRGLELDPDGVIVGLCLNDVFTNVQLVARPPGYAPVWGGRVRLAVLAQRALESWSGERPGPEYNVKAARRRRPRDFEALCAGLVSMQNTLAPRGVRLVVVVFPMLTGLRTRYPFRGVHQLVSDFCAEQSIECVDLLDRFLGRDERALWVHPTDQHPNDAGHRLLAEGILDHLSRRPLSRLEPADVR